MKLATTGTKRNFAEMYCLISSGSLRAREVTWSFVLCFKKHQWYPWFTPFLCLAAVQCLMSVPNTATTCIYTWFLATEKQENKPEQSNKLSAKVQGFHSTLFQGFSSASSPGTIGSHFSHKTTYPSLSKAGFWRPHFSLWLWKTVFVGNTAVPQFSFGIAHGAST